MLNKEEFYQTSILQEKLQCLCVLRSLMQLFNARKPNTFLLAKLKTSYIRYLLLEDLLKFLTIDYAIYEDTLLWNTTIDSFIMYNKNVNFTSKITPNTLSDTQLITSIKTLLTKEV